MMIRIFQMGVLIAIITSGGTGCAPRNDTCLKGQESRDALVARANNTNLSAQVRSLAVFSLFANHIRLGMSSSQMRAVLSDPKWINECSLVAPYMTNGKRTQPTVLELFREQRIQDGTIPFGLELCLTDGSEQPVKVAEEFIKGGLTNADIRLVRYTLHFPRGRHYSRHECFSASGIKAYGRWDQKWVNNGADPIR
jgi:hypothetical protein